MEPLKLHLCSPLLELISQASFIIKFTPFLFSIHAPIIILIQIFFNP